MYRTLNRLSHFHWPWFYGHYLSVFHLVGGLKVINSSVESCKVDWWVKFKQPLDGGETARTIRKKKANDLNYLSITVHALKSNILRVIYFSTFMSHRSMVIRGHVNCGLTLTPTSVARCTLCSVTNHRIWRGSQNQHHPVWLNEFVMRCDHSRS